jgi:glutamine amidotransferase
MIGAGLDEDPVDATAQVLARLTELVSSGGYHEPLRFTSALTNGQDLFAFRYAANDNANTLYYRESGGNILVVSEPLDSDRAHWKPVPPSHAIVARAGRPVVLQPFLAEQRVAAE